MSCSGCVGMCYHRDHATYGLKDFLLHGEPMGFPKLASSFSGGPRDTDSDILGSLLGSPTFRGSTMLGFRVIVPRQWIEYGVYGDLIMINPKPYSIYLRGTITRKP